MARIDSIFKEETKRAELHPKRVTKWIHYSKLKDNKAQYRFGKNQEERDQVREKVEALADLIAADGEVLQDLLVRKTGTDEYEIIAGHFRRRACQLLVEERGEEKYAMLPCVLKNLSDARAEFQLYSTNGYGEKTPYEIMCELEGMKHLLENYPEEFPEVRDGRMVERLAKKMNMKKTTVGDYQTISKNLGVKAMEEFKVGTLKKSAALELCSLPEDEQEKLLEEGKVSYKKVKEYKNEKISDEVIKTNQPEYPQEKEPEESCGDSLEEDKNYSLQQLVEPNELEEVVPESGTHESDIENPKEVEGMQGSSLPVMKNMDQREDFVRSYHSWKIWTVNELTEETYYRFDLPDGSAIIVKEYPYTLEWKKSEELGSELYLIKKNTKHFRDGEACMTQIKEHLKIVGKDN